jgi:hypothetical protein
MGRNWQWATLTLALGSAWLGGCGGDDQDAGGAGGRSTGGAGAGGTSGSAGGGGSPSAGKGGTAGQAGMAGNGGGGAPADPGLDCTSPNDTFGVPIPLPVNGKCLKEVGAENGGARILSRSFHKSSVLADASGETIVFGETTIGPELDSSGGEVEGTTRLAFLDRASLKITSEIATNARPYPRAVSDTRVVWHQLVTEGPELRLATRAAGVIAESTQLVPAKGLSGTGWEKGWIEADQLFYEEDVAFNKTLRRVPLAGGTVTTFEGLLLHTIQVAPPLAIGSVDSFDNAVHVLQLSEDGPAVPLGQPLVKSRFSSSSFAADASNVYALVGQTAGPDELYRMPLDGSAAPTKLGDYVRASVLTSDTRFFVTYDQRFVRLVPVSGGESIELADFGRAYDVQGAVTTAKHLFLIVDGAITGASSYLVEVALPQ